jgi:uncharacterized protein YgiM (DUF1202 family)
MYTSTAELIGIVVNCNLLNVRKEADSDSGIICTVSALSELMINLTESTDEFYKVYTVTGVEGFCLKKYVAIKQ